jgi:hypothetical protein
VTNAPPCYKKLRKKLANPEKTFIEASSFTSLSPPRAELRNITQLHHGAKGLQDLFCKKTVLKLHPLEGAMKICTHILHFYFPDPSNFPLRVYCRSLFIVEYASPSYNKYILILLSPPPYLGSLGSLSSLYIVPCIQDG